MKGSYKVVCEIDQLPLIPKMYQLWMTVSADDMIIDKIEKVATIEAMRGDVWYRRVAR